MFRSLIGFALAAAACSAKEGAPQAVMDDAVTAAGSLAEASERGLTRADAVPPPRGGYDKPPEHWDDAKIFLDDKPAEDAVACLRDRHSILAQFSHENAETIYAISLEHPPTMTVTSEGLSDKADRVRIETKKGVTAYEGSFGRDNDDFGARTVKVEAPEDLRSCW